MSSDTKGDSYLYVGGELELFNLAVRWKRYWSGALRPFIGDHVLEVGAGICANTKLLALPHVKTWHCLEPDAQLCRQGERNLCETPELPASICNGTVADIHAEQLYDTILYIDVLEHIQDDAAELQRASQHLAEQGHLLVLAPAFQALFSRFDAAIGHHRRYTAQTLKNLAPPGLQVATCFYLDAAGLLASYSNKLFLGQDMPSKKQIRFWDSCIIPCSKVLDRLLLHAIGKSVVCVYRKAARLGSERVG